MILTQVRREFAVRSLLWWIPVGAAMGAWLFFVIQRREMELKTVPFESIGSSSCILLFLVWMGLSIYLLNAGSSSRVSTRLDPVLPLSARRLWIVHMLVIIASAMIFLAVMGAVVALGNLMSSQRPLIAPGLLSFGIHFTVGLIFTLAVLQSPSTSLYRIPNRFGYIVLMCIAIPGYLGLVIGLSALPRIYTLIPFGLSLILFFRIYLSLPRSFAMVPREPYPGDTTASVRRPLAPARGWSFRWLLFSTIWRCPLGSWTWAYLPLLAFHGFVISLGVADVEGSGQLVPYIFFTWIILCVWLLVTTRHLYRLDALPIRRNILFASYVVPAMLTLLIGYVAGGVLWSLVRDDGPAVNYLSDSGEVQVPRAFWEIDAEGIEENGTALVSGYGLNVYNPFQVHDETELAHVLSRAVAEVHGRVVPAAEIEEKYLSTGPDGHMILDEEGQTCLGGHPYRPYWGAPFPLLLSGVLMAWLLFMAITCRVYRGVPASKAGVAFLTAWYFVALIMGVGSLMADASGLVNLNAFAFFLLITIQRFTEGVPGGVFTFWGSTAVLLPAMYLLALSQFRFLEVSVKK